jgi:hypothetical protein
MNIVNEHCKKNHTSKNIEEKKKACPILHCFCYINNGMVWRYYAAPVLLCDNLLFLHQNLFVKKFVFTDEWNGGIYSHCYLKIEFV